MHRHSEQQLIRNNFYFKYITQVTQDVFFTIKNFPLPLSLQGGGNWVVIKIEEY